jgi:hypothetical protein
LVDLRQASAALFGLLILGCGLAAWRYRDRLGHGAVRSAVIGLLPALLILLLWGHYAATQIPGGQFAILPVGRWHWAELPQTLHSMARVMLSKLGLFGLILFVGIRALLVIRSRDDLGAPAGSVVLVAAVVSVGSICFLAFTYLAAEFEPTEAAAAASFWRYMGEVGSLTTLGAVAGMPLGGLRRVPLVPAMAVLAVMAVVLPVLTVKLYRADLESPVPLLRQMARFIDSTVPRSASLELVDMTGNGFAALVVHYDLVLSGRDRDLPPRSVTQLSRVGGLSGAELARNNFAGAQYIWLAEGAPDLTATFGLGVHSGCSYLLRRGPEGLSVVRSWPIGPYRWGTDRAEASVEAGASCD